MMILFCATIYLALNKKYLESFSTLFLMLSNLATKGVNMEAIIYSYKVNSWSLMMLSIMICSCMILANSNFFNSSPESNFILYVMLMLFSLIITFSTKSLMVFYIFFEFSIIPIFFILSNFGKSKERLQAAMYMFFYTLTFSLPFIIHMLSMNMMMKNLMFHMFFYSYFVKMDYFFVMISILMFFVKIPCFFLHLWLPKAHVEAPVSGSMILAGLLLKLGVYGLFFYSPSIFFYLDKSVEFFFQWSIWGALLAVFPCLRQVDLKKMIAYMSIMHMGMCSSGLLSFCQFSESGVFYMMISHGLTSSILFFSLNSIYERHHTRSAFLIKGSSILIPSLFLWMSMTIVGNIGVPPTLSFFSELILIFAVLEFSHQSWWVLMSLIFMSSTTSFYYLMSMSHGNGINKMSGSPLSMKENLVNFIHLFPLFFVFLSF
uniref:NADH dehydrogenase subunit 4 n=1 Tax=Hygrobates turcicus TaxID=2028090 RepID=UPI002238F4DE|nr:NADH dehydrogenase subunit 4 [Hygrobates turcicus]UYS90929.1 NADH dehydrogenase subunit 4 [Hygrobates turcicus]